MKQKTVHPLRFKNYFSYLYTSLKYTPIGQTAKSIYRFFGRYILVGRIFKIARAVFIYAETCAYILFLSTLFLILVPVLICILLVFILKNILLYRRCNKYFSRIIGNQNVIVFFSCDNNTVQHDDTAVTLNVSSRAFFKSLGCAKRKNTKAFTITLPYFYSLKRRVLNKKGVDVTYVKGEKL